MGSPAPTHLKKSAILLKGSAHPECQAIINNPRGSVREQKCFILFSVASYSKTCRVFVYVRLGCCHTEQHKFCVSKVYNLLIKAGLHIEKLFPMVIMYNQGNKLGNELLLEIGRLNSLS